MKVTGISGSPRRGGNSEALLDRALEGAVVAGAAVEKVVLNDLQFRPCQECGGCDATGVCVLHDDMEALYRTIESSDALIVVTPVFFGSVSAQLKMMIDRFQCRWVAKYVINKAGKTAGRRRRGVFVCVSGSHRKDFFENARAIVRNFFAALDIEYQGEILCVGIEKKDDIKSDTASLTRAFELGRALAKAK